MSPQTETKASVGFKAGVKEKEPKKELVKKKKKKNGRPTSEKKKVKGQKLRLWVPPCVFNYKNAIEL